MRIHRRWVALLGVTALATLWAFAVACGDEETWPQTVLSGNATGNASGGSEGEADSSTPVEAGDDADDEGGVATFSCETFASGTGTCTTYTDAPSVTATGLQTSCSTGGGTVLSTACPSAGTGGNVNGCCTSTASGFSEEQCFYGSNTNTLGTSAGCSGTGGTPSLTP
jgi:hypothetical protein